MAQQRDAHLGRVAHGERGAGGEQASGRCGHELATIEHAYLSSDEQ
jgi:hypothetical protein